MRKTPALLSALLVALLLASCAPSPTQAPATQMPAPAAAPSPSVPGQAAPVAQAPAKQAWELEWDRVLVEGRREGRILLYSTFSEVRPLWSAAMERYGIKVEAIFGGSADIVQRITVERRAGIYSGDLDIGGIAPKVTSMKPSGFIDPMDAALILPEVTDPKVWYEGKLPFVDKEHTMFCFFLLVQPTMAINTNLVKPGEVKSYNDLLNPKWREKMAMLNPTRAGTGSSFINAASEIMGWDYLRKLAENKPVMMSDERLRLEWLAQGKVAILINPQAATLAAFRQIGAPVIPVIPEEGGWVSAGSGGVALLNRMPHPNAAKVFLNWLLSKEGQTITSKGAGSQSARLDVPTDFLDPVLLRDPAKKYLFAETEEYRNKQTEKMKIAADVFKDVLR